MIAPSIKQMRIELEDLAVLERPGLALVAVHAEVLRLLRLLRHERPFQPGREACSAPPAQIGLLHLVGDLLRLHAQRFAEHLVAAVRLVDVDAVEVRDVGENAEFHGHLSPFRIVSTLAVSRFS